MKKYLLFIFLAIFLSCSTVPGDKDFHPNLLIGQRFYSEDNSGSIVYFMHRVPNTRLMKKADFFLNESFIFSFFFNSLIGKKNRELERNILSDEIRSSLVGIDTTKEILVVHDFKANQQSNFLIEFCNNFFPLFVIFPYYVPWTGSAELSAMSKSDYNNYINSGDISSTPSDPSFNEIVVLKNGEILEGVKTIVTAGELIVTDSKGKTTVYKKKEVLSVKKKR